MKRQRFYVIFDDKRHAIWVGSKYLSLFEKLLDTPQKNIGAHGEDYAREKASLSDTRLHSEAIGHASLHFDFVAIVSVEHPDHRNKLLRNMIVSELGRQAISRTDF